MMWIIVFIIYLLFYIPLIKKVIMIAVRKDQQKSWKYWKGKVYTGIAATIILTVLLFINYLITEGMWFNELGYLPVFIKKVTTQILIFFITTILIFAVLHLFTYFSIPKITSDDIFTPPPFSIVKYFCLSIAVISAWSLSSQWQKVLLYINQVPTGLTDPIFMKDISFYLFTLPIHQTICLVGLTVFILFAFITVVFHLMPTYDPFSDLLSKKHLLKIGSILTGIIFLFLSWYCRIAMYNIVYSPRGVVFGASYADVFGQKIAYKIFSVILIISIFPLVYSAFKFLWKRCIYIASGVVICWLLLVVIFPGAIHFFIVKPNELEKEKEYIQYNIEYTNKAYGLDKIKELPFAVSHRLTKDKLIDNKPTIENIRFWDYRALKSVYNQRQLIRYYYDFADVDIDRYTIGNKYKQVMLSVREINKEKFSPDVRTWINDRLKYTHGYGICLNLVSEFKEGGIPNLLISDIPPKSAFTTFYISRPEIYFGELTKDYVIVNTTEPEFDYPKGEENIYSHYQAESKVGIKISSFIKRLMFAIRFNDIKLIISTCLTKDSRILMNRQIQNRIANLAPFLELDEDVYPVISDGNIFWIQDLYTVSNKYPYSQPYKFGEIKVGGNLQAVYINYIRNSVKAVVNAYNGTVDFYVFDENCPIINSWKKIFPTLFKSQQTFQLSNPELIKHIRYPKRFLKIQAKIYATYHMKDYRVFYNKEDLWEIANEVYEANKIQVEPYYIIMKIPGEIKEEFILMLPFTPTNRDNMISWLSARCNDDNYGTLICYKFPKGELIYGPLQIEARADQNPEMSEKFSLWGQLGSSVIRGNLLVIPIADTILYAEPIYLKAQEAQIPEIKKILLASGDRIEWGDTFEEVLEKILVRREITEERPEKVSKEEFIKEKIKQIKQLIKEVEEIVK